MVDCRLGARHPGHQPRRPHHPGRRAAALPDRQRAQDDPAPLRGPRQLVLLPLGPLRHDGDRRRALRRLRRLHHRRPRLGRAVQRPLPPTAAARAGRHEPLGAARADRRHPHRGGATGLLRRGIDVRGGPVMATPRTTPGMSRSAIRDWTTQLGAATLGRQRPQRSTGIAAAVRLGGARDAGHLLPAQDRAGGVAQRGLPAGGAARRHLLGDRAGSVHLAAERGVLQLLPHPPHRQVHDRRRPQLGRPGRVHDRRPVRQRPGRARPVPGPGGRAPARRGRPGGRAGPRAPARRGHAGRPGQRRATGGRGPGADLGGDRAASRATDRTAPSPRRPTRGGRRSPLRGHRR